MKTTGKSKMGAVRIGAVAFMTSVFITVVLTREAPTQRAAAQGLSTPAAQEAAFANAYCKTNVTTTVPSGSEAEARNYYRDLNAQIGLRIDDPAPGESGQKSTLMDIVAYLGYSPTPPASALTVRELQDSSPSDLMDPGRFGIRLGGLHLTAGDALVARFFAPKISDVSQASVTEAGWRKLVRLRAQAGSAAATHGIESGIILFNFFASLDRLDPFAGNDSVNTQTILVGTDTQKSLYWIDFGRTSEGAAISHQLNAFFDAGHIPATATAEDGGAASYFVPCGCISCHGGLHLDFTTTPPAPDNHFRSALLDYLDTDHWQERTQPGDDFEGLKAPVLFDPGTFGVILMLNEEIRRQNVAAQPDSVLRRAAEHWVSAHLQNGPSAESLFARALARLPDSPVWKASDPADSELLPKLNRLCFRCHGSVMFDIFDKEMVLALRTNMFATLFPKAQIVDKRAAMPPDRNLSSDDLKKLRDLLLKLK